MEEFKNPLPAFGNFVKDNKWLEKLLRPTFFENRQQEFED